MTVTPDDIWGTDPLDALLSEGGLTRPKIIAKILEKLDAKTNKIFYDSKTGEVIVSPSLEAHDIQLRAAIEAAKLLRMYPNEKLDLHHSGSVALCKLLDEIDGTSRGLPGGKKDPGQPVPADEQLVLDQRRGREEG